MSDVRPGSGCSGRPWWIVAPTAVVAFLLAAALIFPLFSRGQPPGPTSSCLSHLRQIGMAMHMYAAENGDRVPPEAQWPSALRPHLGDDPDELLHCPSADTRLPSYAMDDRLTGTYLPSVPEPAMTVVFYDGRGRFVIERHNDGANYCFADGHAKWEAEPPEGLAVLPGD